MGYSKIIVYRRAALEAAGRDPFTGASGYPDKIFDTESESLQCGVSPLPLHRHQNERGLRVAGLRL